MILELPWPPSVNRMYRTYQGRMLISREGREYRQRTKLIMLEQHPYHETLRGRLRVTMRASPPDRRKRDLDNLGKCLLDVLGSKCGAIYEDDSQIDDLRFIRLEPTKPGFVSIEIEEIAP